MNSDIHLLDDVRDSCSPVFPYAYSVQLMMIYPSWFMKYGTYMEYFHNSDVVFLTCKQLSTHHGGSVLGLTRGEERGGRRREEDHKLVHSFLVKLLTPDMAQ